MSDDLATAQARVGRTLNNEWKLERVLGIGGMAAVYEARNHSGSAVAIKMLHPELSSDADVRERFLREGYAANRIPHDGVLKVLGDAVDQGEQAVFLVMELLDGETLDTRLERKGGALPVSEVLNLGYYAADALSAAHAQGILHRDIKPDNLFLTRDGRVKILDFGLARLQERAGLAGATQEGSVLGTPAFMAPEHALGKWSQIDARADIWGLGATLFTLLSGQNVHEGRTPMDVLVAAATKPARSLALVCPQLARDVVAVVDRAVAFRPEDRFPDMASFRDALAAAAADASGEYSVRPSLPDLQAPVHGYLEGDAHARALVAYSAQDVGPTVTMDPNEQAAAMRREPSVAGARQLLAATIVDPSLAGVPAPTAAPRVARAPTPVPVASHPTQAAPATGSTGALVAAVLVLMTLGVLAVGGWWLFLRG
jgi:eukaryotic-like serine/threonine-protein kinase